MIFPLLNGLLRFRQVPITWILFFLNTAVYFGGMLPAVQSQKVIDRILDDEDFIKLQGRLFAQFVESRPSNYSEMIQSLAERSRRDEKKYELLGSLAVRDTLFMSEGPTTAFRGDQLEIERWRNQIKDLKMSQESHPSYLFGLTADDVGVGRWLSYIFVHSGPYHFIGNMYFLLIFGSMLEPVIGGLALMIVFVFSGMIAAATFVLMTGATAAPLIGASGAVSGLMALFCLLHWKKPVRFAYMLLPSSRYSGLVYLPAWVVFLMFALSDLAGYWGAVSEFGGVAYTAHLGGDAAAILIAATIFFIRKGKLNSPTYIPGDDPAAPVGQLVSIHDMVDAVRRRVR